MPSSSTNTAFRLISIFQIVSGFCGIVLVAAGLIGIVNERAVRMLWFGFFPILNIIAGVLLWRRQRHAVSASILIQLVQVPFIQTNGFTFNLGMSLNFRISGIWQGQYGDGPLVLGFNVISLVALIILLRYNASSRAIKIDTGPEVENNHLDEQSCDTLRK